MPLREELGIAEKATVVEMVGRITHRKGQDDFVWRRGSAAKIIQSSTLLLPVATSQTRLITW